MRTTAKLAALLLCTVTFGSSVAAFTPVTPQITVRNSLTPPRRSLPIVHSLAYPAASASLLYRATQTAIQTDKTVLIATAALALLNLGPTDNARLASAKRASEKTRPPAATARAKARQKLARQWRNAVRIKLVGQFVGLMWMAAAKSGGKNNNVMWGATTIMASNVCFLLCGGGRAMHDSNGDAAPMAHSKFRSLAFIDLILTIAAFAAAISPNAAGANIFAGGAAIGALEGLANIVKGVTKGSTT